MYKIALNFDYAHLYEKFKMLIIHCDVRFYGDFGSMLV
jgi:hypothetical protein